MVDPFWRRVAPSLLAACVLAGCTSAAETSTSSTLIARATSTLAAAEPGSANETGASADDTEATATAASRDPGSGSTESTAVAVDSTRRPGCDLVEGFDQISEDELPDEALDTIEEIEDGAPYPFDQDGGIFQNRERLLPSHQRGYYREFTVVTPGENDRGPRRIVTGDCDEMFYTDDHYDSFQLIEG